MTEKIIKISEWIMLILIVGCVLAIQYNNHVFFKQEMESGDRMHKERTQRIERHYKEEIERYTQIMELLAAKSNSGEK